jgi:hypothetical protein
MKKTAAAVSIVLAFVAATPALGQSHHRQPNSAAFAPTDSWNEPAGNSSDVPWAPF